MGTNMSERLSQGSMLAERYRLGPLRSTSDVCQVFDAWDELLEREVAVKTLDGLPDDLALARAMRAVRAAARIVHPHVVEILDVVRGDPSFLVLERHEVEGPPAPQSREERFALADHVLAGLAALHAGQAVHRDVRADNVLCTRDGRVLLTTTGITAAIQDSEQEGDLPADVRSDVLAAGVLLRELLGDSAGPEVQAILDRATAQDPSARPSNAGELRDALRQHAPRPPTPPASRMLQVELPPPVSARPRRRSVVAVLLVGIAAAGLGFAVRQELRPAVSSAGGQPSATDTEEPSTPLATPQVAPLGDLLERPGLTPSTEAESALLQQVRDLERLEDPERAVVAAELLGRTVTGAAEGGLSRDFARDLFDVLATEVTLPGVIALGERDPALVGPFVDRLRALPDLAGEERAREAADLFGDASTGATISALPPDFRAAATAALLSEVTLDGVIALAELDNAVPAPFVDRLRALRGLEGEERGREAAELFGQTSRDEALAPGFRAVAAAALLPEVTLDGVVALAERDPAVTGPDGGAFVDRLQALRVLEGEERARAAAALLADVDAGAPGVNLSPPFRAVAAQILRPMTDGST